jgi:hypothetical protein
MSVTTRNVSPGRTGRGNWTSPIPGDPRLLARRIPRFEPQTQRYSHRMQARGDQAAVGPFLGELAVDVEGLRGPIAARTR